MKHQQSHYLVGSDAPVSRLGPIFALARKCQRENGEKLTELSNNNISLYGNSKIQRTHSIRANLCPNWTTIEPLVYLKHDTTLFAQQKQHFRYLWMHTSPFKNACWSAKTTLESEMKFRPATKSSDLPPFFLSSTFPLISYRWLQVPNLDPFFLPSSLFLWNSQESEILRSNSIL